ncbi:MAG: HTH domain-containing protein, partial [Lachnospiraceae bacterium]|nr:HTH domain-containing protein [Lachnospiraceae bacterium]
MSATKEKVLQLLQESFDQFRSGQEISAKLDVTRASVWKAIRNLQREGYQIEAVNNRGYRLIGAPDDLNADQIREYLIMYAKEDSVLIPDALLDSLHVYTTVGSTNTVISQFPAPAMVVSEEQTEGRGRRGRSFHSPIGNGIYM